jgi:hypothetical protein
MHVWDSGTWKWDPPFEQTGFWAAVLKRCCQYEVGGLLFREKGLENVGEADVQLVRRWKFYRGKQQLNQDNPDLFSSILDIW